jgi:hypothetical protein
MKAPESIWNYSLVDVLMRLRVARGCAAPPLG